MVRVRGEVYVETIDGSGDKLVKQIGIRANDEVQLESIKAKKEAELVKGSGKFIKWVAV